MDNLKIYNGFRAVPEEAKREIQAGKLKGFTDINPMWRIKMLTEQFGPAGFGWKTSIVEKWIDQVGDQYAAHILLHLFVKIDGEWSEPIEGLGGSMLYGLGVGKGQISDEAYKMAYTDALGIACKALGMAADVYFAKDRTKYSAAEDGQAAAAPEQVTEDRIREILEAIPSIPDLAVSKKYWEWIKTNVNAKSAQFKQLKEALAKKNRELKEAPAPQPQSKPAPQQEDMPADNGLEKFNFTNLTQQQQ